MTPRRLVAECLAATAEEIRSVELAGVLGSAACSLFVEDADALNAVEVHGIRWVTLLTYELDDPVGDWTAGRLALVADHDVNSPAADAWHELGATLARWVDAAAEERARHRIECVLLAYTPTITG